MDGCFPLAPSFDHGGPIATGVAACRQAMEALAPGDWHATAAAGELRIGLAWLDHAQPLVRSRVEAAAQLLGEVTPVELELADAVQHLFMREAAEVHAELFAEHADRYGNDVRRKLVRCLRVTDAQATAAERAREQLRERWFAAAGNLDLLVTPTIGAPPPRLPVDDLALRADFTRLTLPVNAAGWPALALPCGPAEDGIDASVQLIGRPGSDAFVLAAGEALESLLRARHR
jgi:Asp-tRNA(Asn)/Glu-tRNA(Gln) amidotransferase A subunit family amidase